MAYMRDDNYYLWNDGEMFYFQDRLSTASIAMSIKRMDAFVMMRLAQMINEGLVSDAIDRAVGEYDGNIGCTALAQNAETLKANLARIMIKKGR